MSTLFPFLSDGLVFELLVRLALGAIASFVAIVSWTRTRSVSWMFVIAGILSSYAGTLYRALRVFGLFSLTEIFILGAPLGILLSDNLSIVCFIIACIFYIRSHR